MEMRAEENSRCPYCLSGGLPESGPLHQSGLTSAIHYLHHWHLSHLSPQGDSRAVIISQQGRITGCLLYALLNGRPGGASSGLCAGWTRMIHFLMLLWPLFWCVTDCGWIHYCGLSLPIHCLVFYHITISCGHCGTLCYQIVSEHNCISRFCWKSNTLYPLQQLLVSLLMWRGFNSVIITHRNISNVGGPFHNMHLMEQVCTSNTKNKISGHEF